MRDNKSQLSLLTDQPLMEGLSRVDGLGFDTYADVLAAAAMGTSGPFTIGIFGEWGNGKTSLMRLIQRRLPQQNVVSVWFNAWQYEKEEHPIVPLVGTIVQEIERNKAFREILKDSGKALLRSLRAIAYGFSASAEIEVPGFAKIEAGFVMKDMIDRDEALTPDPLIERSLYYRAFETLNSAPLPDSARVVVLIDDLDRCFPDKAIQMLEGIKLVLSQKGFIFILGVARTVIEGYLQHRYASEYGIKSFDGSAYLDKIVQLAFPLPSHANRMEALVTTLLEDVDSKKRRPLQAIVPLVAGHLGANPRSLVRFVNNLLIDSEISERALSETISIDIFAVTRCLQLRWRAFYDAVVLDREAAAFAAAADRSELQKEVADQQSALAYVASLLIADASLARFTKSEPAQAWLLNHAQRESAVQFLQVSQRDTELHAFSRDDKLVSIVAGTDQEAIDRLTSSLRDAEREFSDEHRTYPVSESADASLPLSDAATDDWPSVAKALEIWREHEHEALIFVGGSSKAAALFSKARRIRPRIRTLVANPDADPSDEARRLLGTLLGPARSAVA